MVVTSGSPPYNYDGILPYKYRSTYEIGASGVLFEQAEFVITAELRKFAINFEDSSYLKNFYIYVNDPLVIAPSGPYEPRGDGSTITNTFNPSILCINKIEDLRSALDEMFIYHGFESRYDHNGLYFGDAHKADWIRQTFPNSPSGYEPRNNFYQIGDSLLIGNYLRPVATNINPMLSSDPHYLGGSGMFLDIDFSEVVFQPYPFFKGTSRGNMQPGSTFEVYSCPIFPSFQKTDGSLIATNGREANRQKLEYFDGPDPVCANAEHVSSGYIRMDGYCLRENTKLMLGKYTGGNLYMSNNNDFTFYTDEPRRLGFAVGNLGFNDKSLRNYVLPAARQSGVYRICAKNERSNFPNTCIESGVISVWPQESSSWPTVSLPNIASTSANLGYQVFNDCIWITSRGGSTSTQMNASSSGLALISPWTGHALWVISCEPTPSTAPVPRAWDHHVGLVRKQTDLIIRVERALEYVSASTWKIRFHKYNDLLDYLGEEIVTFTQPASTTAGEVQDIDFNGTDYVVSIGSAGNPFLSFYAFFDTSFNHVGSVRGISGASISYINGKYLAGSDADNLIYEIDMVSDPTVIITQKPIDTSSFYPTYTNASVMDIIEINGVTHLTDGIYALFSAATTPINITKQDLFLLRIEEGASSWNVLGIYNLQKTVTPFGPTRARLDMIYMPIP
jgi:hypothetical protein